MAVALPALAIAGTVASIAATAAGAMAQQESASYNAKVAQNNATASMQQAQYANSLKQMQLEKTLGSQRAAAAASGVVGGSLDNVEYNTLVMGKLDQLATTYEGEVQATRSQSEAQLDQIQGQNAEISGGVGILGDALQGGSKYASYSQQTAGSGMSADYAAIGDYPSMPSD